MTHFGFLNSKTRYVLDILKGKQETKSLKIWMGMTWGPIKLKKLAWTKMEGFNYQIIWTSKVGNKFKGFFPKLKQH